MDMFLGNVCQSAILPALVRPPLSAVQSSLGMKQFLPFPLDATSTVNLFPSFSAMDPVQKAVLHHTFGVPASTKRKHVSCGVCQLRFNSQSQALAHYKGTKHAKKLKSLDSPKCKQKSSAVTRDTANKETTRGFSPSAMSNNTDRKNGSPGVVLQPTSPSITSLSSSSMVTGTETTSASGGDEGPSLAPMPTLPVETDTETEAETETEEEKARRLLYCSLCKVAVNSASQLEAHNSGTKHKTMLEARTGNGAIKSFPRPGVKSKLVTPAKVTTGLQNKTFHCETCDVHVNSETQLKQHISSRRHKDRAAGKPAKPKYSPYTKPQRGQTKQPVKLMLGKELCQPLATRILPAQLAAIAAAAAAVSSAFSLRTNHGSSLFQTQSLSAALLRPAPGPVRTAHMPVLFAPY